MKEIKELYFTGTVQKNNTVLLFLLLIAALFVSPGNVFASGGVTEFATPFEKTIGILQGPAGLAISVICLIIAALGYAIKGSDISDTLKGLVNWAIPISLVCSAGSFVTYLFQFTGAIVA